MRCDCGSVNFETLEKEDYMDQTGYCTRFSYHRCMTCGAIWFVRLDLDNPDPVSAESSERLSPERASAYLESLEPPEPVRNDSAERFNGTWRDESGRTLVIRSCADGSVTADYLLADGTPVLRNLLNGTVSPSLKLQARVSGESLIIELGTPGLGAALTLVPSGGPDSTALLPGIDLGLYDDWESGAGVPWALPLSVFELDHQ